MSHLSTLGSRVLARMFGCAAALSIGSAAMATPLSEPQSVPLAFLMVLDEGPDWLRGAMTGLGVANGYSIGRDTLVATEQEALVQANRIRSFVETAAPGRRAPYILLHLADAEGEVTDCATFSGKSVLPNLDARDFGVVHFPMAQATSGPALDLCQIAPGVDEFAGLSRADLRGYFDAAGDLEIEQQALNQNPDFVRALILAGYYVIVQDVTGRLRIR